jgi:hypothetical protein
MHGKKAIEDRQMQQHMNLQSFVYVVTLIHTSIGSMRVLHS